MKSWKTVIAALALGVTMVAAPGAANATAFIQMKVFDKKGGSYATSWKIVTLTEAPRNGVSCEERGNAIQGSGYYPAVDLTPPFSGSASRTRWVTVCKNGAYLTVKLKIELSSCHVWICSTTNWTWDEIRRVGLTYDHDFWGGTRKELDIVLNPR